MSKRVPKLQVIDMLGCLEKIQDYTAGMTYESFLADSKTQDAVIRNIQILGEAANGLPDSFRNMYPDIEWSKIIRRHVVTHEYDDIDHSIIWRIITVHSIPLKLSLEKILNTL